MSKYQLSRKVLVDIICNEPITPDSVAGARYAFKYHNAENADILAMHHKALRELHKTMERQYIDLNTYQGLKIYHDSDLRVGEWRVRKINERIEDLKDV